MWWRACITPAKWTSAEPGAGAVTMACLSGTKASSNPNILSATEWALLPAQITVRIIRFTASLRGFRNRRVTLVTTLLDPTLYPARELIALYLRRWRIELCLRDLKTTMGMEQLRCKTPDMAEKELLAYLVAHNLVRCVIAEAVTRYPVDLERVSFKGSVDALRQYSDAIAQARNPKMRRQLWEDLLLNLVRDLVRHRPNRTEPRAVKRRPRLILYSTSHAITLSKSPTAIVTGKADPAIIEALTKGHSCQFSLFKLRPCFCGPRAGLKHTSNCAFPGVRRSISGSPSSPFTGASVSSASLSLMVCVLILRFSQNARRHSKSHHLPDGLHGFPGRSGLVSSHSCRTPALLLRATSGSETYVQLRISWR